VNSIKERTFGQMVKKKKPTVPTSIAGVRPEELRYFILRKRKPAALSNKGEKWEEKRSLVVEKVRRGGGTLR